MRSAGVEARLEEFDDATPTAEAAARAAGCALNEIVKSLVFDCDGRSVLVMVPGDRRAGAAKVAAAAGSERARPAAPEQVQAATGFDPGAVAPFPRGRVERVLLDPSILDQPLVWVGAGSPRHLAAVAPRDLVRLTGAEARDVTA